MSDNCSNQSEIANNWSSVKLGDVCTLKNGFAFKSAEYKTSGIPIIRISDINNGLVSTEKSAKIDKTNMFDEYVVKHGEMLIAMSGATTGKFGIYKNNEIAYQNQRVGKFQIFNKSALANSYLFYLLYNLKRQIEKDAYGGAQPNISSKLIEEMHIPLPPLSEQHRIVAKIEELFSELDKGVEALKTAQQQLKVYRQAVLKWAFEGKLTEKWRKQQENLPAASQLLEQIKTEREREAKTTGKKLKPVDPINETELTELPELTDGWCWVRLVDVADKITDGEHFRPQTQEKGIYFLSAKDVRDEGVLFNDPLYISEETAKKALQRCNPEKGDILIVECHDIVNRFSCHDIVDTRSFSVACI